METRIYHVAVTNGQTGENRLVEATSAAQAVRYIARGIYTAKAATPKTLAGLMSAGVKVERAIETETNGIQAEVKQENN